MKVRIFIVLLLLCVFPAFSQDRLTAFNNPQRQDTQSLPHYDEVRSYLDSLVKEGGFYCGLRLFSLAEIPALLSFADDTREIKFPPVNPFSSYLPSSCSVGVYSLWLIDCIQRSIISDDQGMKQLSEGQPITLESVHWGYLSLAPELSHDGFFIYFGDKNYAYYQRQAAEAYRSWWNSGPLYSVLSSNPLESTGLHWY